MSKIEIEKNKLDRVKNIYEGNTYFSDALDWYSVKYLTPFVDRSYFLFLSIISFFIILIVAITIKNLFPLSEPFPIMVKQKDTVLYEANIRKLKPANMAYNTNQSIARHLTIFYVKELLTHQYESADFFELNNKLEILKQYSSKEAYDKAQSYINQKFNEFFNNNTTQSVIIKNFKFVNPKNTSIFRNLKANREIYNVELNYTLYGILNGNSYKKNEKIILTFKFNDIHYNEKAKDFDPIIFIILDFKMIQAL